MSSLTPSQPNLNSLPKSFEHVVLEKTWSRAWEDRNLGASGYRGTGEPKEDAPSFSIQLPPPNVTGTLHMGHAFNQTIMDTLARYHRMSGNNTAWIPGTDHAGIATQIVVERQLVEKGTTRQSLGRKNFVARVWEWKETSGNTIATQMRKMGSSVDWGRQYFTMDEGLSDTVTETFVRLHEQGLIYRGKRLVNWDPSLKTAVSDLEVESQEEDSHMWHIRYFLADGSGESIVVATTRPETLLGDSAVMVNPNDERYAHLVGKMFTLPLCNRIIPMIEDDYVDMDFGTGVVKVTPAHDANDYAVGQRHNLPMLTIFTLDATINESSPLKYQGMDRFLARAQIIDDLKEQQLLVLTQAHKMMVPRCTRTGQIVEPMLTDQWFMAMDKVSPQDPSGLSIAQKAVDAVANGEVRFVPDNWVNTFNQWMGSIQDWCISRQLWWGHQIPAWYDTAGNVYVARSEEVAQKMAGAGVLLQRDPDVLDTWYSSAMVPFSTMGWPNQTTNPTDDYNLYLPSSTLVTGYDIIFFWVARMIMMTKHFTGRVPFKDVYIHGLVRDAHGKKMSKSEGNVIDPVDLIDGIDLLALLDKRCLGLRQPETADAVREATTFEFPNGIPAYGADAMRFTFASLATLGRSINFDSKRCEGYRNFCNKLWNATRFVLMQCEGYACGSEELLLSATSAFSVADRWILSEFQRTSQNVAQGFKEYRLDNVANSVYDFAWNEFCSWYLEIAKVQMQKGTDAQKLATRCTLIHVLERLLRLAHPLMPYITEELWQKVARVAGADTVSFIGLMPYPVLNSALLNEDAEESMLTLKGLVNASRTLRAEMGISPATKLPLYVTASNAFVNSMGDALAGLAKLSEVTTFDSHAEWKTAAAAAPSAVVENIHICLYMPVDASMEKTRLQKEYDRLQVELEKSRNKLKNEAFLVKAPSAVLEQERLRFSDFNNKMEKMKLQIAVYE